MINAKNIQNAKKITSKNIRKKISRIGEKIEATKYADPFMEKTQEISNLKITKALYQSIIKTRKR